MANDNTLGAPTEGLGQNVTFAFNPPSGVPQLGVMSGGGTNFGIQEGNTPGVQMAQGVQAAPFQLDPTMATLLKFGDKILKKKLEDSKTEAFVNGMQQAMSGVAIQDIVDNQPWYTKIFGDSDVVEGARAYAGQTIAQTQVAAMEDKMPELRKMDPNAAKQFFIDSVKQNLTGDKPTDLSVMQAMTRSLPSIMRRQAKEHFGWQQENATVREGEAFKAGAQRLQAASQGLAKGYVTPEEFEGLYDDFERSLMPVAGRDEKSYKDSIRDLMIEAAHNGQFHALNAMKPRQGRMGLVDVLDADQRTAVEKAIESGEIKLRTKYSFDWNDDLAKIEAQASKPLTGQSTGEIAAQIDALNMRYNAETGSDSGIIPPTQRASLLSGSAVAIAREKDRQADEAATRSKKAAENGDKAEAAEYKKSVVLQRAAEGSLGTLSANSDYSKEYINEQVMPVYRAMKPQDKDKFLVTNLRESYVIDPIKMEREGSITSVLSAGQYTPAVQEAFDKYSSLRDANRFAADEYYGRHAKALEGMYNDIQSGHSPDGAFARRFLQPQGKSKLNKEDLKSAVAQVTSDYNSFLPAWAGGQVLRPDAAREIVNDLSDTIEEFHATGVTVNEATARALHATKLRGREILGGYTWKNGKDQKPLSEYLTMKTGPAKESPIPTDRINDAFKASVDELLYGSDTTHGILPEKAESTQVIRLPDRGGVPMFHVLAHVEGKPYEGVLTGADVFKLASKRKKREGEAIQPASTQMVRDAQQRLDSMK